MITFPNITFSELFSPNVSLFNPYTPSTAVLKLHSVVRGGQTNDITLLKVNESGYFNGAIASSILLIIMFSCWGLLLIHFKQNPSRFGFLSGNNFNKDDRIRCIRPLHVRITYLMFCGLLLLFSVLWTSKGAENVSQTTSALQGNTYEISHVMTQTIHTIDELMLVSSNMTNVSTFLSSIDNICPNGNLSELLGEEINPKDISNQINEIQEVFNEELLLNTKETISNLQGTIMYINVIMNKYNNGATSASSVNYNWKALLFVLPYVICTGLFVVGVLLIFKDATTLKYQDSLSYWVSPLFIILVLISTALGIALRVIATMNADACISPDYTMTQLSNSGSMNLTSDLFTHMLNGCSTPNPLQFINQYQTQLETAITALSHFSTVMSSMDITRLNDYCKEDLTPFILHLQILSQSLVKLYRLALGSISLYSCPNLNHLYVSTVHDTLCTYSPQAIRWIYTVLMGMSISGWFMITLRSSYLPDIEIKHEKSNVHDTPTTINPMNTSDQDFSSMDSNSTIIPTKLNFDMENDISQKKPYQCDRQFFIFDAYSDGFERI